MLFTYLQDHIKVAKLENLKNKEVAFLLNLMKIKVCFA